MNSLLIRSELIALETKHPKLSRYSMQSAVQSRGASHPHSTDSAFHSHVLAGEPVRFLQDSLVVVEHQQGVSTHGAHVRVQAARRHAVRLVVLATRDGAELTQHHTAPS